MCSETEFYLYFSSVVIVETLFEQKRRLQAVDELIRILKPGGRGLIYVWALEQERNNKKSNYLKDSKRTADQTNEHDVNAKENASSAADESWTSLPVHVNRTQFKAQDLLVPWHLRKNSDDSPTPGTYLRYYHVFVDGELELSLKKVNMVNVLKRLKVTTIKVTGVLYLRRYSPDKSWSLVRAAGFPP